MLFLIIIKTILAQNSTSSISDTICVQRSDDYIETNPTIDECGLINETRYDALNLNNPADELSWLLGKTKIDKNRNIAKKPKVRIIFKKNKEKSCKNFQSFFNALGLRPKNNCKSKQSGVSKKNKEKTLNGSGVQKTIKK
ncbi:hypothetical protein NGRA_2606 [Nosema granulosis]|uniref:Uncharacterized protein n=1 Tax=Nosema granulosis TaxID=83296 RepID=A0A9P6KYG6_9MICR|nr:hypothetical protein NGRA_2606 [Nosema granulosis]